MNKTIMNKVRCMLSQSGLPEKFWAECVKTVAYLINLSPCSTIDYKSPMEVWKGEKPSYKHLTVFGCVAYAHKNQGKLEPIAVKCVLLGYPDGVKGYNMWTINGHSPKMIISRDVVFNEQLMYKDLSTVEVHERSNDVQIEVELDLKDKKASSEPEQESESRTVDQSYQLARDRERRALKAPARYGYADIIAYAFAAAEEEDLFEPLSLNQAMSCKSGSKQWVKKWIP